MVAAGAGQAQLNILDWESRRAPVNPIMWSGGNSLLSSWPATEAAHRLAVLRLSESDQVVTRTPSPSKTRGSAIAGGQAIWARAAAVGVGTQS